MPCFHPLKAFQKVGGGVTWTPAASNGNPMTLPCGRCIGCRLDKGTEWATRIMHESRCHKANMFVTLTYDDEHLPRGGTLVKRHVQLFMKSLRFAVSPKKVRFFACGEYGSLKGRPHYHLIIFGHWFDDAKVERLGSKRSWSSATLTRLWGRGRCEFGDVTPGSAKYVGRYVTKKITGDMAASHYERVTADGEIIQILPEFALMSTKPGIGRPWLEKFHADAYTGDFCLLDGKRVPVPKYYDRLQTEGYREQLVDGRRERAKPFRWNQTPERLEVRETCTKARVALQTKGKLD